jgi:hypothetical protein
MVLLPLTIHTPILKPIQVALTLSVLLPLSFRTTPNTILNTVPTNVVPEIVVLVHSTGNR